MHQEHLYSPLERVPYHRRRLLETPGRSPWFYRQRRDPVSRHLYSPQLGRELRPQQTARLGGWCCAEVQRAGALGSSECAVRDDGGDCCSGFE